MKSLEAVEMAGNGRNLTRNELSAHCDSVTGNTS